MKTHNPKYALIILTLLYVVGVGGMLSPYRAFFVSLTPFNLLITLGLMLFYQEPKLHRFYSVFYAIVLSGFVIELIGVNTGYPFGEYTYGNALGPKILGTPPLIGVNWFILVYSALCWVRMLNWSKWISAFIVGGIVVLLDLVMEPVAVELGFWTWMDSGVPIQNYIAWFCIGASMAAYLFYDDLPKDISVAKWVFVLQILFFVSLYLLL